MTRPRKRRFVEGVPTVRYFKPVGVPLAELENVVLTPDEIEAIRLADLEHLYQQEAAESMGVSRQTFGRILSAAHEKIAHAIIHGHAFTIEDSDNVDFGPRKRRGPGGGMHRWRGGRGRHGAGR
jgi:predicted DNA-binding protein (UPF0251 family)